MNSSEKPQVIHWKKKKNIRKEGKQKMKVVRIHFLPTVVSERDPASGFSPG
jgi:hypothetical protein